MTDMEKFLPPEFVVRQQQLARAESAILAAFNKLPHADKLHVIKLLVSSLIDKPKP